MKQMLDKLAYSLVHWTWTKGLLYWLIMSAGTMAECAFLLASLWMCINASVHGLMRALMTEAMTVRLTEISTMAYVALPECILPLACVITISHVRTWRRSRDWTSIIWAVMYGLPTLVFLVLSLFTLGSSVVSAYFQLPNWMIVIRALAGYQFAFTALLYWQLGHEQEADRLAKKDADIERLNAKLEAMHMHFKTQVSDLTDRLKERDSQVNRLAEHASSLSRDVLASYPKVQSMWVELGVKTVTLGEIEQVTGLSRQRINAAAKAGKLQKDNRKKDGYRVSSIIEWLKTIPVIEPTNGHVNGDTDPLGLPVLNVEIA